MSVGTDLLIQAFRLWVTDNVPASGANWPNKAEIIAALQRLAVDIGAAQAGITTVANTAARDAYFATPANQGNLVYVNNNNGSATDPANGVYEYVSGAARIAQGFYAGVAAVVQPLVDEANEILSDVQGIAASLTPLDNLKYYVPQTLTWTTGSYYAYPTGNVVSNASYARVSVPVNGGEKMRYTGDIFGTAVVMAAFFDGSGTRLPDPDGYLIRGTTTHDTAAHEFTVPAAARSVGFTTFAASLASTVIDLLTIPTNGGQTTQNRIAAVEGVSSKNAQDIDSLKAYYTVDAVAETNFYYYHNTGVKTAIAGTGGARYRVIPPIAVTPGETVKVSGQISGDVAALAVFTTAAGGYISTVQRGLSGGVISGPWVDLDVLVPAGAAQIRLTSYDTDPSMKQRSLRPSGGVTAFRGVPAAVDVSSTAQFTKGRVADGTWFGPIIQPVNGAMSTAIVDAREPVRGFEGFGQSNNGRGGVSTTALATALFVRHMLMFSVGASAETGSSGTVNGSTLTDIIPAFDQATQPQLLVACGVAFEDMNRQAGKASPGVHIRTDWWGGHSLQWFKPGQVTFTNKETSITRATAVYRGYGRDYDPTIICLHGENGATDAAGAAGSDQRVLYFDEFGIVVDAVRAMSKGITGKIPPFLYYQVNWADQDGTPASLNVDLAQRDFAVSRFGTTVACVGPTYANGLDNDPTQGNNPIHFSQIGRMMQGELAVLVDDLVRKHGYFTPFMIESISRNGAVFTVRFRRPTGVNPAELGKTDSDYITEATTSNGWRATLASNGNPLTILSMAWSTVALELNITLSADPGGPVAFEYARAYEPVSGTRAARRGKMYISSGVPSTFAVRRDSSNNPFNVPAVIRHYLMADRVVSS